MDVGRIEDQHLLEFLPGFVLSAPAPQVVVKVRLTQHEPRFDIVGILGDDRAIDLLRFVCPRGFVQAVAREELAHERREALRIVRGACRPYRGIHRRVVHRHRPGRGEREAVLRKRKRRVDRHRLLECRRRARVLTGAKRAFAIEKSLEGRK